LVVTVVVVVGAVVVTAGAVVVVVGAVVVVTGTVVVVATATGPEEVNKTSDDPLFTATGFFDEPESHPATKPRAIVELETVDVAGHVAVICSALSAAVAVAQLIPARLGSVTATVAGPLETVTLSVDPAFTLAPAAGDCDTMSPDFTDGELTCAVTSKERPSALTSVEASANVSPEIVGTVCLLDRYPSFQASPPPTARTTKSAAATKNAGRRREEPIGPRSSKEPGAERRGGVGWRRLGVCPNVGERCGAETIWLGEGGRKPTD
jgi:hypothetical protein